MKKLIISMFAILLIVHGIQAQKKETRNVDTFDEVSFRIPGKLYLRQGTSQKVELQGDNLEKIKTNVEGNRLVIETEGKWLDWSWNDDDIIVYITMKDITGLSVGGSGELVAQTKITASDLDLRVSGSGSLKAEIEASGKLSADVSGSGGMDIKGNSRDFGSSVSGSGKVVADQLNAESMRLSVSGSGKIQAGGVTKTIKVNVSGSGRILAANLETERCDIHISGSGGVEINVKEELDATISGSGTVAYKGNPRKVNSNSSGSGTVKKL